jgi:pimeloyl-CoA dehydrogenase small subunit
MNFDLDDEQRMLKDSVDRLIGDAYGAFEQRQARRQGPRGWDEAVWRGFAEMGLTALPFAEEDGGFGGGPVETAIVMEAIGRGLALEPYLATVVLAGSVLRLAGSAAQRARLVPHIAAGTATLAFAHSERQARYDLHDVATSAVPTAGGFVLDGLKTAVLHGDGADWLVVGARTAGGRRDRDGITLFLVDPAAPGVTVQGYPTQDGLRAAEIAFSGVQLPAEAVIGTIGAALPVIEAVADIAIAALAAEAVGAMDALHALTVDYLKTRQQFGVAIGSFQSLQHKAVDMMIALEQARSMALYAAMMLDADPAERRTALSAVKLQVNRSARLVGQMAIQLHGGIGLTMEYKAGHLFKRLSMIELLFGDADHHLRALSDAGGLLAPAA